MEQAADDPGHVAVALFHRAMLLRTSRAKRYARRAGFRASCGTPAPSWTPAEEFAHRDALVGACAAIRTDGRPHDRFRRAFELESIRMLSERALGPPLLRKSFFRIARLHD